MRATGTRDQVTVVDASVAAKWFFPEADSDRALRLLSARCTLWAPDLVISVFGNLVWKRFRRGEVSEDEARAIIGDFLRFPLQIASGSSLATTALDLAMQTGRTVYDCLYLALAIRENGRLVTGNERFVNALSDGPFSRYVRGIGAGR